MEELNSYKILDKQNQTIKRGTIQGLKDARKKRDKLNQDHHGLLEIPKNPNEWRYCLFKGLKKNLRKPSSFFAELAKI